MNFKQLTRRVNSDEEAVRFFQEYHVLPTEMTCANGHQMTLSFGVKIRWRCRKSTCRHVDKGIRVSNWLRESKLPLETAVHSIYCWAHEMTSIDFCQRELDMWNQAVVDIML